MLNKKTISFLSHRKLLEVSFLRKILPFELISKRHFFSAMKPPLPRKILFFLCLKLYSRSLIFHFKIRDAISFYVSPTPDSFSEKITFNIKMNGRRFSIQKYSMEIEKYILDNYRFSVSIYLSLKCSIRAHI